MRAMPEFMVLPDDEQEELAVGLGIVGMGERHRPGALGGNVEPAAGDFGRGIAGQGTEADVARSAEARVVDHGASGVGGERHAERRVQVPADRSVQDRDDPCEPGGQRRLARHRRGMVQALVAGRH